MIWWEFSFFNAHLHIVYLHFFGLYRNKQIYMYIIYIYIHTHTHTHAYISHPYTHLHPWKTSQISVGPNGGIIFRFQQPFGLDRFDPHRTRQAMPIFQKMSLSEWGCQQRAGLTRLRRGKFFFLQSNVTVYIYSICNMCFFSLRMMMMMMMMNPFKWSPQSAPQLWSVSTDFHCKQFDTVNEGPSLQLSGPTPEKNGDAICRISTKNNRDSDSIATVTILVQAVWVGSQVQLASVAAFIGVYKPQKGEHGQLMGKEILRHRSWW